MGSTHFLILPLFPSTLRLNPTFSSLNPNFSSHFRCSSSSRPNSTTFRVGSDEEFGFPSRRKRRNWWSDDDDDDDVEDDEFGFSGEPNSTNWIFEVFRAFGWMVPALLVPILMGKEENSWMMALVLPLGQTALSLVMDKLWGDPSSNLDTRSRPRTKSRKSRARSRTKSRHRSKRNSFDMYANGPQESRKGVRSMRGSYQSWEAADSTSSASKGRKGASSFGGWDE